MREHDVRLSSVPVSDEQAIDDVKGIDELAFARAIMARN